MRTPSAIHGICTTTRVRKTREPVAHAHTNTSGENRRILRMRRTYFRFLTPLLVTWLPVAPPQMRLELYQYTTITDAKYGSIKLVTISGTINFLLHLQKIYAAFSVHSKNETVVRQSLETCKELLNQSNTFIKATVDKVKETCNISKQTNGSEGTVLKRSQVYMLYHSIIRLSQIIGTIDQQFTPNLESCLTTIVENIHALSHLKHALPTKLQYCRDFGTIFRESVKRIVHWSACYFTSDSSYYPVPTYNLPLYLVSCLFSQNQRLYRCKRTT